MPLDIKRGKDRLISREGVRAPNLYRLANGDLLMTFDAEPDMMYTRRDGLRSTDRGRTWRPEPRRTHREMALGQRGDGLVLAMDVHTFKTAPGVFIGSFCVSTDGGATFSGPRETRVELPRARGWSQPETAAQLPGNDNPYGQHFHLPPEYYGTTLARTGGRIRLGFHFNRYLLWHGGRWLAAMYGAFFGDSATRSILVASDDGGRVWSHAADIAFDRDGRMGHLWEPALCAAADGSLLCVMRRGAGLPMAQCRSTDGGITWSRPRLIEPHGINPDLCLMSNGVLACVCGRPGNHIFFSEDGCGHAWGYPTVIGTWHSSANSAIIEAAPRKLLLAYDRHPDTAAAEAYTGAVIEHAYPTVAVATKPRDVYRGNIWATTLRVNRVRLP